MHMRLHTHALRFEIISNLNIYKIWLKTTFNSTNKKRKRA